MKKRIFALALALCMMLSAMPTSFAGNGFLTLDGQENVEEQPREQQQEGILTLDDPDAVITQEPEEEPVYGVLTPDTPSEEPKAPVVEQSEGVLYVECPECGYLDGYHADDCPTIQPEEQEPVRQPETSLPVEDVPVVSTYSAENVSSAQTARTLTVVRNASTYNLLRNSLMSVYDTRDGASTQAEVEQKDAEGLVTSKDVTYDDDKKVYTVTLEAYTTGTVTDVSTTKPTDIVLVLDQSGSMSENITFYTYGETYDLNTSSRYYVYNDGAYLEVSWCNDCNAWTRGCWNGLVFGVHFKGKQYEPMTGADDTDENHVQFYEQTGSSTKSKLTALKEAVTVFANSVVEQTKGPDKQANTGDDVDHRIAIVGFSSSGYNNTELLTGVTITTADPTSLIYSHFTDKYEYPLVDGKRMAYNGAQYESTITSAQYKNALQDMTTKAGRSNVAEAIAALTAHGGTNTADGLNMAQGIFDYNSADGRNRVVVVFTDGDSDQPTAVVNKANELKQDYGASIYTIGVFENADDTVPCKSYASTRNKVMHGISSNYPSATADGNYFTNVTLGDINPNVSEDGLKYYLEASNADALTNVFQKISGQISQAAIDLDENTVVKDILSESFAFPKTGANLQVFTAACKSYDEDTEEATWYEPQALTLGPDDIVVDEQNNTVTVKGFDFTENFVSENAKKDGSHGKKLIITFDIVPNYDTTLGGSGIASNGDDSGIYSDGTVIEHFYRPTVDVETAKITPNVSNQNIYLSNPADLTELLAGTDSRINGSGNAGVDVTYTLYQVGNDGSGTAIATLVIPAGKSADGCEWTAKSGQNLNPELDRCTEYYIVCEVVATENDKNATEGESSKTWVHVYKPEVTFKDSTIYLSQTPDYAENYVSVVWKDDGTPATEAMGDAPTLVYDYNPANDFTDCTDVDVAVAVDQGKNDEDGTVLDGEYDERDVDITTHVTFVNGANSHAGSTDVKEFTVHVLKPSFTVTCTDLWADYGQSITLDGAINASDDTIDYYISTAIEGWTDAKSHTGIPAADESKKPADTAFAYTYFVKQGEQEVTEHKVGTTDKTFTVELTSFNIGTFKGGTNWYTAPVAKTFTVFVNKFDLTITKNWADVEDCYKQDVIFTITGDYGTGENQNIQVVIPVGKTSVKVVGLLCGQSYSVAEANPEGINWAWRFTNTQKPNVTCNVKHDVISTTEHLRHTVNADFINSNPATKWFDAIASKFNIFRKGGN